MKKESKNFTTNLTNEHEQEEKVRGFRELTRRNNGWEVRKLREILTLDYGKPLPYEKRVIEGRFPVYGANGLKGRSDVFYVDKKTIIVGRKGSAGEINLTEEKFWPLDVTYFVTFDEKNYDLLFLFHLLTLLDLPKLAKGVKPGINRNEVYDLEVLIPPFPEQKRIVAILDKCFTAIDKAKAITELNLKNAKELFESYLQGVFEGGNWDRETIENVCAEIFAGGDAPKDSFSEEPNEKNKIPIYANAVKNKGLYGFTNFARVTKPSVTISARGSGTGHTELRIENYLPIVRLIVCIPETTKITLEFLKFSIDNLEIMRSGSAIPQLTVPMIKDYSILLPTLKEQKAIVRQLDALRAETKKLEMVYNKKIADLEELKKSILQKAFAGELE